jgi:dTDP-4-amino-4,6-dideoxygalactose transaminase
VWHLFVVECDNRDDLRAHLRAAGIPSGIHYPVPLHLQPAFRKYGSGEGSLPAAERRAARGLSLPMHERLTGDHVDHVARSIEQFFARSKRRSVSSAVSE